jgi:hypothetical protein
MDKTYRTRVIAVLQSGNGMTQDFYTPNSSLALVQFGEGNAEMLQDDPVVSAMCIEIGREDWTAEEEHNLSQAYLADMLADSVHAVS